MAVQTVFKRYELKYLLTLAQKETVLKAMQPYMTLDKYGRTTIRNLYYDTDSYLLIRRSIEKPAYKEKLRLRSYSRVDGDTTAFVELKKKYKSIVYLMDNKTTFKRGDMFYADMPQGVGSEQSGYRPVIILQNDVGNKHSTTVIVAPLTSVSHTKAKLPTHYTMKAESGLEKPSIVLLEQIHTIDKQRLQKYIGKASDKALAGIEYGQYQFIQTH